MNINTFFCERISHFEDERRLLAEYVALITPDQKELHLLDWELK